MILEENRTASYIRSLYTGNTELLDTIDNECKHFATVRDLL